MVNPNIKNYGFGSSKRSKEFDDAARAKSRGVPKPRKWSREKCIQQLEEIMDILKKRATEDENLKDLEVVTNKMMDIIRYLYPPVQQSVNMNIDITANAVMERLKNWKKEQVVVIGGEEDEEEKED